MKWISLCSSFLLLAGCGHTINLTVRNPTQVEYAVEVGIQDDRGISRQTIPLGNIEKEQDVKRKFELKRRAGYEVRAAIPGSAMVYRRPFTVTPSDPKVIEQTVVIRPSAPFLADFDLTFVKNKLKDLGPGLGLVALPVPTALRTLFGAVVAVTKSNEKTIVHKRITPEQLRNAITLEEFRYPSDKESLLLNVERKNAAQLAAHFAIFGNLNFSGSTEDVYKLNSSLENFGPTAKPEKADFELTNRLSTEQKRELRAILRENPGSELYYISDMWVVRRASVEVYKGNKLSANADVKATDCITANGAFTFSDNATETKTYDEMALDFWGQKLSAGYLLGGEEVVPVDDPRLRKQDKTLKNFAVQKEPEKIRLDEKTVSQIIKEPTK